MDGLENLYNWFRGGFMGNNDKGQVTRAIELFKKISKVYHKPISGKYYRAIHLRTNPKEDNDSIMKRNMGQVSNKKLQSWSTDMGSALYFFEHFCRDQNQHADPEPDKAWVIVGTDCSNLNQLLTYDECMEFCWDVANTVQADRRTIENAKKWTKHMATNDEMLKLHELICEAKKEKIPYTVEKIMVDTYKKDTPLPNKRGNEPSMDDLLRQLFGSN